MVREDDAEEIAVRSCRLAAARLRHARGRRGTVVAVADVDRRQRVEQARELGNGGRFADHPQLVSDIVVGRDGDVGVALGGALQGPVQLWRMRIGHHDGAGLGVERLDLPDAICLLHRRRQLVLADAIGGVVGERGDAG